MVRRPFVAAKGGRPAVWPRSFPTAGGDIRKQEAGGHPMFTYCAGCANWLRDVVPVTHVMDLVFEPDKALKGKSRVSRAPMTYLNRLWVKRRLKRTVSARVSREREFEGKH